MKKTLIALSILGAAGQALALTAGDIAIIQRTNDGSPDSFAFVALAPITTGSVIYFTDNGWTGTGYRGASATDGDGNENFTRFTAASNIAAGTVISSSSTSFTTTGAISGTTTGSFANLAFSQGGEQISAFTSTTTTNPLFNVAAQTALYTLDDTNGFENATNTNTGNVPAGLVSGVSAVSLNFAVGGSIRVRADVLDDPAKTKDEWLAAFANQANWESGTTALPTTIAVAAIPEPSEIGMMIAGLGIVGAIARRRRQA